MLMGFIANDVPSPGVVMFSEGVQRHVVVPILRIAGSIGAAVEAEGGRGCWEGSLEVLLSRQ